MPESLFNTTLLEHLIKIIIVVKVIMLTVPFMILAERKVSGWMQDRIGPNRCGPKGIIQPFADGLKLFFKEDYTPTMVDKIIFPLAPCIAMFTALIALGVMPLGGDIKIGEKIIHLQIAQPSVGMLFMLAVSSLAVYAVVLGGWASNSKYSFLGGLRAAAQMISYEVPMGLAVITMALIAGTLRLEVIVDQQITGCWYVFTQPLVFMIFLICMFAETNRAPFDLAECEQELVAGFHTEYSSMKFAMFFLGEYAHMIVASAFAVALFFGGWHIPGVAWTGVPGQEGYSYSIWAGLGRFAIFYAKIWIFIFLYLWVRWTLPRFRYDQLMRLSWHGLVPLGIVLLLGNAVIAYWDTQNNASRWIQAGFNGILILGLLAVSALTQGKVAELNKPLENMRRNHRMFRPRIQ